MCSSFGFCLFANAPCSIALGDGMIRRCGNSWSMIQPLEESTNSPSRFAPCSRLHPRNVELETRQRLDPGDHPDQRSVGEAGVTIAAPDVAVGSGKPGLLDMALRRIVRRRPEGRNERTPSLVDGNRMQSDVDVGAKLRVVQAEEGEGEIPAERCKSDAGGTL
jgi:hypothetical protein